MRNKFHSVQLNFILNLQLFHKSHSQSILPATKWIFQLHQHHDLYLFSIEFLAVSKRQQQITSINWIESMCWSMLELYVIHTRANKWNSINIKLHKKKKKPNKTNNYSTVKLSLNSQFMKYMCKTFNQNEFINLFSHTHTQKRSHKHSCIFQNWYT